MDFHLHLIDPLQDFFPEAAPQNGQNVSRPRSLSCRSLHCELYEKGKLHACWARD